MVIDEDDYEDADTNISRTKFLPGALNLAQFQPIYLLSTWKIQYQKTIEFQWLLYYRLESLKSLGI